MKYFCFICFLFFTSIHILFGQNNRYKLIDDSELELINSLSSTFKDTSLPMMVSPFITLPVDSSSIDVTKMTIKYGFDKSQFKSTLNDTFLLKNNKYFNTLNPDSLLKFDKSEHIISSDSIIIFIDSPILYYIEKYYHKKAICSFHKPIVSKNSEYAIVEYWIDCGNLCGWGQTVLMRKIKNNWIIVDTLAYSES